MKNALAAFGLLLSLILLPFALDWRSPFLFLIRGYAFVGLVVVSLLVMTFQIRLFMTAPTGARFLRIVSAVGFVAALAVLASTLTLEARFHWIRHQVLHADFDRLRELGKHVIVGYRSFEEVRRLVEIGGVSGVFITTGNVRGKTANDILHLTDTLQSTARKNGLPKLWIATDQEGGIVSRMSPPLPQRPSLSKLVEAYPDRTQLNEAVGRYAELQGSGLADVGVNLNFAPVVDLNHNIIDPHDRYTRIYQRAVSHDPAIVTDVARRYCAGLERSGVRCTLKHFPGLGRVRADTHVASANLDTPLEELNRSDWVPFRTLMGDTRAFVMLGHVRLTALDPNNPASASSKVISGLIRGKWGYDGVLITDSMTMRAVYRSRLGTTKASIQALNAGMDLILLSWDPSQYYPVMYALLRASETGELDKKSLKRSSRRLDEAREILYR